MFLSMHGKVQHSHNERLVASQVSGKKWDVRLIKAGRALNAKPDGRHIFYHADDLKAAMPLFEGRPVYAIEYKPGFFNHMPEDAKASLRGKGAIANVAAVVSNVRWGKGDDGEEGILGTLEFYDAAKSVQDRIREDYQAGRNIAGLSIDGEGASFIDRIGGEEVHRMFLSKIDTIDIVTEPAAGGEFMRIAASFTIYEGAMNPTIKSLLVTLAARGKGGLKQVERITASTGDAEKTVATDTLEEQIKNATGKVKDLLQAALSAFRAGDMKTTQEKLEQAVAENDAQFDKTTPQPADPKPAPDAAPKNDAPEPKPAPQADQAKLDAEATAAVNDLKKELETVQASLRSMELAANKGRISDLVSKSPLPEFAKKRVTESLHTFVDGGGRFDETIITKAISDKQDELNEMNKLAGPNANKLPWNTNVRHSKEDAVYGLDAFFMNRPVKTPGGYTVQPFRSVLEAARVIAGIDVSDPREFMQQTFGGGYYSGHMNKKFWERQDRVVESIMSANWATIFGDSVTRRAIAEYRAPQYNSWRKMISEYGNPKDFKANNRYTWGGYGTLPVVAKDGTYQPLTTPGEESGSYAISKRGGLEYITIEDIANDDMRELRKLPMKLGGAAILTLYDTMMNIFLLGGTAPASGGTAYIRDAADTNPLFHASHNNTGTTALGRAALKEIRSRMRRMVARKSVSSKSMLSSSNMPKTLWLPPELEEMGALLTGAQTLVQDAAASGEYNISGGAFLPSFLPNVLNQGMSYEIVELFSDATDFFVTADPSMMPLVEVGFWNGQEEPELFTEAANSGSNLTADNVVWKIRHVWGYIVLDYRGFQRHVVAG